jgi:hypothetical protein
MNIGKRNRGGTEEEDGIGRGRIGEDRWDEKGEEEEVRREKRKIEQKRRTEDKDLII